MIAAVALFLWTAAAAPSAATAPPASAEQAQPSPPAPSVVEPESEAVIEGRLVPLPTTLVPGRLRRSEKTLAPPSVRFRRARLQGTAVP